VRRGADELPGADDHADVGDLVLYRAEKDQVPDGLAAVRHVEEPASLELNVRVPKDGDPPHPVDELGKA